ncbi:hypothetical protein M409DRAFT_23386 [Zasmidium cellare ATCC 36951]|uniref:Uncharacterized protein n=1 Tax=Zasmidium cellare ATCC 36951 TaxID=1080233 RepID=A0A6A6CG19_ZASCE|nr:uncharacterized protein M409DRAFT_23386 [Zasmidium cellare ATCC 36951]KAF2166197.1 hypothetical protein M409DRAFT_23386 [Zasmidium cellare ATCC 36951]
MSYPFEEEDDEDDSGRDPDTGLLRISETKDLSRTSYSRENTIAAFRDYYNFLQDMYLDESRLLTPPEDGWREVTVESMQMLGKTDEVAELLKRLPYVKTSLDGEKTHTLGRIQFADWTRYAKTVSETGVEAVKGRTEDPFEPVPPHVIGLTDWGNKIFLDTQLGVVYFVECPHAIRFDPNLPYKPIEDDPYEYALPDEAEWRGWGAAWGVREFFEVMKWLFRELQYVPVSRQFVEEAWEDNDPETPGARAMVQDIFRKHGWPVDMEHYQKQECLDEVESVMERLFPGMFMPYL